MQIVRNFLTPLITNAIERKQARATQSKAPQWVDSEERVTLLDHLVSETDGTIYTFSSFTGNFSCDLDQALILDETINMLFAGRDTASPAFSSGCLALADDTRSSPLRFLLI